MSRTNPCRRRVPTPHPSPSHPNPSRTIGRTHAPQSSRVQLNKHVVSTIRFFAPMVAGILAAASLQNKSLSVAIFVFSLLSMIAALFFVFYSILSTKDQTLISMPTVYNPDGTKVEPTQLTVFDHDNKIATYLASELPVFSVAAIWLFLWTQLSPALLAFEAFFLYRLFYHPIFRIHIFNDENNPDTHRPFGAAPLFKQDSDSPVKLVAGKHQFQQALASASKDSLVILDCSAAWCAPCRKMAPLFTKLAEEFNEFVFLTIDVDVSQDVASDLNVTSLPSFYIYRDQTLLEMVRGASPQKLRQSIQSHM